MSVKTFYFALAPVNEARAEKVQTVITSTKKMVNGQ